MRQRETNRGVTLHSHRTTSAAYFRVLMKMIVFSPVVLSQLHGRLRYAFRDISAAFKYPFIKKKIKEHRNKVESGGRKCVMQLYIMQNNAYFTGDSES